VHEYNTGVPGGWSKRGGDIDGGGAGDRFGSSVALNDDGSVLAAGGASVNNAGYVRVYDFDPSAGGYVQRGLNIVGEATGDYSCTAVALRADGDLIAIGARENDGNGLRAGHVRVYEWPPSPPPSSPPPPSPPFLPPSPPPPPRFDQPPGTPVLYSCTRTLPAKKPPPLFATAPTATTEPSALSATAEPDVLRKGGLTLCITQVGSRIGKV
jgi:hypothetical protein